MATESSVSSTADSFESESKPATSIARTPFDNADADADLILQSSDNVNFYVHKLILKKASSVFADMFTLAQGKPSTSTDMSVSDEPTPYIPIVPIAEASSIIDSLLRICYPVYDVYVASLTEVADTLAVALKYEIEKAIARMKKELLTRVPSNPISVFVVACTLNCEYEATAAVKSWRISFPYTSSGIGGRAYDPSMQRVTAAHLYRFIRFCRGDNTTLCSPPPQTSPTPDDETLSTGELQSRYRFTHFPGRDIIIRSIDNLNLPAHTSHLDYAGGHAILDYPKEICAESGLPVICLDEDGRTLAAFLQLCYPFGEQELLRNGCSVSVTARARKAAEKYGMLQVAEVAEYLMAEQMNDHPIDVYFAASRYGWKNDAQFAASQCLSLPDIENPEAYTREMEFVSAEVYYNLLKQHDEARPRFALVSSSTTSSTKKRKPKRGR